MTHRAAALRWIALLDYAELVRAEASPMDPVGMRKGSQAIDSLFLYEHTLDDTERRLARTLLWRRDHAGEPVPDTYDDWHLCRCRICATERRLVHRVSQPTPTITLPASDVSSGVITPIAQGVLLP